MLASETKNSACFILGNETCAEVALVAGYPITPSTEIAEILSKNFLKSEASSSR